MSSWSRLLARAAREALGLTPSSDQLASALLGLPQKPRARRCTAWSPSPSPPSSAEPSSGRASASFRRDRDRDHHRPSPPVEVRRSRVPDAGHGLFSTRRIARGELVAVYAGVYTPVPPVTPGADGFSVLIPRAVPGDDGGTSCTSFGGYLDGAEHAARARIRADAGACAGWGVAALANHPPENRAPNVEAVEVRWEEFPRRGRDADEPRATGAGTPRRTNGSDASEDVASSPPRTPALL